MHLRHLLFSFLILSASAYSQTLTVISGNGQLAYLGTGLSGGPVTFQLLNGTTPIPNETIVFSTSPPSNFLPLSVPSAVTDSNGEATVQFTPAFLGPSLYEQYKLIATAGSASVTFYEAAAQPPVTVNYTTSAQNVLYPVKATASQPASFHFTTMVTGGLANVSTRIVPVERAPVPPGTAVETAFCQEGAANPQGAVFSNTAGQAVCTPVFALPNASLNPAYDTFTFDVVVGGVFTFGPFSYDITAIPLTASLPSTMVLGQINTPLNVPITVAGGVAPYTFEVQGGAGALPAGVSVGANGVISGTPTTAGTYPVTIVITDHAGATKTIGPLTLGISAGPFQVTPLALPAAILGVPYLQTLQVTGGVAPYKWALNAPLPKGLTTAYGDAMGDSLIISGTPTTVGVTTFTALITDSFGEQFPVPAIYTLAVTSPVMITTPSLPVALVNTPYTAAIVVSGGSAPYTYNQAGLPTGLTLNADGTISGTPTVAGVFPVTVTITDSLGQSNSLTTNLTVSSGPFSFPSSVSIPAAIIGTAYSTQLPAPTGGVPPYSYTFSGTPPAGINLTAGGLLTTTPAATGTTTFSVTVQDSAGQTATVPITLTVNPDQPTISALVNAASFLANAPSPGELVSVFGTLLGPDPGTGFTLDSNGLVPTNLAGVQVSFGGVNAPVLYVSSTQLNVVVPFGVVTGTAVPVTVSYGGKTSASFSQSIGTADPGVFLISGTQGAVLNSDYSINGAAHPASAGQFIQIYGTGAGAFTPAVTDGQLPTDPSSPSVPNVSVTIGGVAATVLYAGVAPGEVAGVTQINVVVPSGTPTGPAIPLVVTIGSASSQAENVTVAIQ